MKTLITILALLFITPTYANSVSKIPSFTCRGRVFTDTTNLKVLWSGAGIIADYTGLQSGAGDYQVPGGKTFRVVCVKVVGYNGTGAMYIGLGYVSAGNGPIAVGTVTAPTSPTWAYGRDSTGALNAENYVITMSIAVADEEHHKVEFNLDWGGIPATSYLFSRHNGAGSANSTFYVYGYEE